jgi:hypothetical protein
VDSSEAGATAEDGSDVGSGEDAPVVSPTGASTRRPIKRERVGLPPRPFLYTLDQIAALLNLSEHTICTRYIFYQNYTHGPHKPDKMLARNITREGAVHPNARTKNDWRVSEQEFMRWMKRRGFIFYERSWTD